MMKKKKQQNPRFARAFTIIELSIVIMVIAVLATVTFVSYRGVQDRAEVVVIMSDLDKLSDEMQFFYKDNGRYPLVFAAVGSGDTVPELETVLRNSGLYDDTREPNPKKAFVFCASSKTDPQRYAIIASKSGEGDGSGDGPITNVHYVTSDHAPSSTPLVMSDAVTAADPASRYGSNACNTVNLKTGTSYFTTFVVRWSFDVPKNL